MARSLVRSLRPVLVVGYGAAGLVWLRRVATSCLHVPLVTDLVKKGVIQFWAVGSQDCPEGSEWWNPQSSDDLDAVRSMLDRARRDELRSQVPGLELHQVLLLERVSLYDPACEQRGWLYEVLESARVLGDAGSSASTAFEVDWLTLADGTWPNGKPVGEQKALAERIITAIPPRRVLYVDRQSAAKGVVTTDASELVLARLAVTILSSDLGFPRREASDDGASTTLRNPTIARAITPISVLTLVHRRGELAAIHGEALLRQILTGAAENVPAALRDAFRDGLALDAALDADLADARAGGGRFGARERRRRSIALLIAHTFAELAPLDGGIAVKRLRDRIAFHSQRGARFSSVDIHQASTPPADSAGSNGLIALWRRFLAYFARILRGTRTRGGGGDAGGVPAPPSTGVTSSLDDVLRDWESIAGRLDTLFNQLALEQTRWNSGRQKADEQVWAHSDEAYCWRLSGLASGAWPTSRTPPEVYARFAEALAEQFTLPGHDDDEGTLRRALQSVAERDAVEHSRFVERQLRAALGTPDDALLCDAVRSTPLLVGAAGAERVAEITWLTASPGVLKDLLRSLESTQLHSAARVLATEDAECTVRVAFGEELPWQRVASLSYLSTAIQTT